MAIAFRAVSSNIGAGANPVGTEPTGTVQDDVLVAMLITDEAHATTTAMPTGWTNLYNQEINQGADFLGWRVGYIRRGASAPNLTWTSNASYNELVIVCFSGVDTTTALDSQSAAGATGNTSGHNIDPPATTAVSSSAMAVCGGASWRGPTTTWGAPTGYTMGYVAGAGENTAVAYKLLSASGTENPSAFSGVSTGGSDWQYWDGFTITLNPGIPPTVDSAQTFRRDQRRPGPYQPMGGRNVNPGQRYH